MEEQNKHILKEAISQLPDHSVNDSVWENIKAALQEDVLQKAIGELPVLEAKEELWGSIESELTFKESISKLAQHTAPESLWSEIDKNIDAPVLSIKKISSHFYWLSGVAALLVIGFVLYPIFSTKEEAKITYSQEVLETSPLEDWDNTTKDLEVLLDDLCDENPYACTSPEFEELNEELAFLDASKMAVLEQVNPFEDTKEAEVLLTKIELERVEILKKLIAQTMV